LSGCDVQRSPECKRSRTIIEVDLCRIVIVAHDDIHALIAIKVGNCQTGILPVAKSIQEVEGARLVIDVQPVGTIDAADDDIQPTVIIQIRQSCTGACIYRE